MTTSPAVSVVMPVYNTAAYVEGAIASVLAQTFTDFELIIVDDAGSDGSIELCRAFDDPRIKIVSQENRGLAGARNTGVRHAKGEFIALLDSDDLWAREKLARHVRHFRAESEVGVSYAASQLIDETGASLRIVQCPRLKGVRARDVFLRNPVGNGSAPVLRRAVFDDIAHFNPTRNEIDYFDDSFRQSEDIECWMRIALTTRWRFEGVPGILTFYRINEGGLSANVIRQFENWRRVRDRVSELAPDFAERYAPRAEAFQLRYLARRCVRMGDGALAWRLFKDALQRWPGMALVEPAKTATTAAAAFALRLAPDALNERLQSIVQRG